MLFLAEIPPPAPGAIETWLLSFAAIVAIAKYGFDFWKAHLSTQPPPHLTYETKEEAAKKEAARAADRKEIKDGIADIKNQLEKSKEYQAKARQRIHKRLNAHENALFYMAGQGDSHAGKVIRRRLEMGNAEDNEE